MHCMVCDYGIDGDEGALQIEVTAIGDLDAELQLPDGGIDARLCGDCWRWIRGIAANPDDLHADDPTPILLDRDADAD